MIVTVDTAVVPPVGSVQLVVRCRTSDKSDVAKAAAKLAMKPSDFIRMAVVQSAREVLSHRSDG